MTRTTQKQAQFLQIIASNPGITTAELHRRVGKYYAHGHHKFTYETVSRLRRVKRVRVGSPIDGLRGNGLYLG